MVSVYKSIAQNVVRVSMCKFEQLQKNGGLNVRYAHRREDESDQASISWDGTGKAGVVCAVLVSHHTNQRLDEEEGEGGEREM